jgi:hypothetical protein
MNILIDINHPAHVHYFKNVIWGLEKIGHRVFVSNRDSRMINYLLDHYKIKHFTRSKRPESISRLGSLFYLIRMIFDVGRYSTGKNIDIYLGFASPACSFWAWVRCKPGIIIDDTEHNRLNHLIYSRFCSDILTPFYFKKDMGFKQIVFKAYVEQFYLHSDLFVYERKDDVEPYAFCRFISYDAAHDRNVVGQFSPNQKVEIVERLSTKMKVFVSQENESVDNDLFVNYKLDIPAEEIHSFIGGSSIFISEGATMACEAGILGVCYHYINPLKVGNLIEQSKNFDNAHISSFEKVLESVLDEDFSIANVSVKIKIEKDTINPTKFLLWFIENYPESQKIMKENPDFQFEIA